MTLWHLKTLITMTMELYWDMQVMAIKFGNADIPPTDFAQASINPIAWTEAKAVLEFYPSKHHKHKCEWCLEMFDECDVMLTDQWAVCEQCRPDFNSNSK